MLIGLLALHLICLGIFGIAAEARLRDGNP